MLNKDLDRGYLMIANSTEETDYVRLAYATALSIKLTQPEDYNSVAIATLDPTKLEEFRLHHLIDKKIEYSGPRGMDARSRAYTFTPFKETVFLDSDMLFLNDVSHWWPYMQRHPIYIASRPMTFRNEVMVSRYYRKVFDENKLPDFYSGWLYFKEDRETTKFFRLVETLTDYPETWKEQLVNCNFENIPTDEACALAAKMLDIVEDISNPQVPFPRFTHMKPKSQGFGEGVADWTHQVPFFYDNDVNIKIGTFAQTDILHYVKKDLITDKFISNLEDKVWSKIHSSS